MERRFQLQNIYHLHRVLEVVREELEAMFSDWIDKADDTTSTKERKEIETRNKLFEEFREPLTAYLLSM